MTSKPTMKATMTPSFLLETPLFRTILFHPKLALIFTPIGDAIVSVRRRLAPTFQFRLLPKWLSKLKSNPALAPILQLLDWTVGQVLLVAPLILAFILCLRCTVGSDENKSESESGVLALVGIVYVFMTASKTNSIFALICGVPVDRLVTIHRLSALVAVAMSICHLAVSYDKRSVPGRGDSSDSHDQVVQEQGQLVEAKQPLFEFLFQRNATNTSGSIVLLFMMILVATSYFGSTLRTYAYQTWYTLHMLLPTGILCGMIIHDHIGGLLLLILVWWVMDLAFRYALPGYRGNACADAKLRVIGAHACDSSHKDPGSCAKRQQEPPYVPVVEIVIHPKPFDYMPGQFIKICVPVISAFEYHSVSISSAPQDLDGLTVHISALGDWTRKVLELAKSNDQTKVWLEGPYGALSFDLGSRIGKTIDMGTTTVLDDRSGSSKVAVPSPAPATSSTHRPKVFVLVSGGIGVAPCRSLGRYLMHQHHVTGEEFKSIKFIWAVRSSQMCKDLPPLEPPEDHHDAAIQSAETGDGEDSLTIGSKGEVSVDIYCTRSMQKTNMQSQRPWRSCTTTMTMHEGRPNLDAIIQQAQKEATEVHGETTIAVLGCGPLSLMKDLEASCNAHGAAAFRPCGLGDGAKSVFINLHIESFDM